MYATKAKDVITLSVMKYNPGETVKAFLSQFNVALSRLRNAEPRIILMSLIGAIDEKSEFGKWIKMKEPYTLEKFYKKKQKST